MIKAIEYDSSDDKFTYFFTVDLTKLPCWHYPNVKPFLFARCLVVCILFLFYLAAFFCPISCSFFYLQLTVYIFIFLHKVLQCGRRRKEEKERAKGLHFVILLFCVSKACSPAWLPCKLLCEGVRHRSLKAVKHCSLYSVASSHEEMFSRESFQFALKLCLYNCAYCLWVESRQLFTISFWFSIYCSIKKFFLSFFFLH